MDYVDWTLGLFSVLGQALFAFKVPWAPLYGILMSIPWVTYYVAHEQYGFIQISLVTMAVFMYAIARERKKAG